MFCKYCGKEIVDGAKFCASCGGRVEETATPAEPVITPAATPVVNQVNADYIKEAKDAAARKILTQGICSLAFTCTFFFGLIGWIIGGVCKGSVSDYEARFGPVTGMAKVGKSLGKGGLIGGIITSIFATIYFYCIFLAAVLNW